MIYYNIKCKYSLAEGIDERKRKRMWEEISTGIHDGKTQYKLLVYNHNETMFDAVIAFSVKENSLSSIYKGMGKVKSKPEIHFFETSFTK